jgi:hypothetical protein
MAQGSLVSLVIGVICIFSTLIILISLFQSLLQNEKFHEIFKNQFAALTISMSLAFCFNTIAAILLTSISLFQFNPNLDQIRWIAAVGTLCSCIGFLSHVSLLYLRCSGVIFNAKFKLAFKSLIVFEFILDIAQYCHYVYYVFFTDNSLSIFQAYADIGLFESAVIFLIDLISLIVFISYWRSSSQTLNSNVSLAAVDETLPIIALFGMPISLIALGWFAVQSLFETVYVGIIGCLLSMLWIALKLKLQRMKRRDTKRQEEQYNHLKTTLLGPLDVSRSLNNSRSMTVIQANADTM